MLSQDTVPHRLSPPSIYNMWDVGLHPLNVQRSLEACQSCPIIVSEKLICACEDKVWPLLYVIVWLTYMIHDPTAQATGESNGCQMPLNSLSFLKYSIPFFSSSHFAALTTFPSQARCQNSDLCFMRDDLLCGGLEMVTAVWNGMINNKRKVMDRDLLVYDYTLRQQIYSIPMETAAWLGSFTEATATQASSVMCLDNNTVFVALDMALWEDTADRFYKLSTVWWANVTVIHISKEGHSVLTRDSLVQKQNTL